MKDLQAILREMHDHATAAADLGSDIIHAPGIPTDRLQDLASATDCLVSAAAFLRKAKTYMTDAEADLAGVEYYQIDMPTIEEVPGANSAS